MDRNDELLVIYKKETGMSWVISKFLDGRGIRNRIVNRHIMIDTLGEYNVMYSDVTDIENIINLLMSECFGVPVSEMKKSNIDQKMNDDLI